MTNTVKIPFLDNDGTLTPLVIAALEDGATSDRIEGDDDNILITFKTKAKADAFIKAAKIEPVSEE